MVSAAVCTHRNATETAMKPLTTHEEFCPKNAAHFVAARGRTPATRTREQFANLARGAGLWGRDRRRPHHDLRGHHPRAFRPHHQRLKDHDHENQTLTAAQIDSLARCLSETPIAPSASAKKSGDNLTRLLAARIGTDRATFAFTSIMSAATVEQADSRLTLVLGYGNTELAGELIRAVAEEPKAATAPAIGKRQAILDQAQTGALPQPPDFSKPTHARFRAKLAQILALAEVGDIAGLQGFEFNPVSSSPKAMARYRELCVIAITARAPVTA